MFSSTNVLLQDGAVPLTTADDSITWAIFEQQLDTDNLSGQFLLKNLPRKEEGLYYAEFGHRNGVFIPQQVFGRPQRMAWTQDLDLEKPIILLLYKETGDVVKYFLVVAFLQGSDDMFIQSS
ncbi:hypothetical protein CGRA01v4_01362 [Colletotrichum graminicola]|nr:hypothetical protein CGRA01v4_01362 [Colletotrichum graminicola]